MKKNLTSSLSSDDKIFADWKESITKSLVTLQNDLSETHRELGRGPETKTKYEFIKARPKLDDYRKRLEKEFGYFALCYSLALAGLFQLEDNKKDTMIAAMSSIPQATIEGIPIVGPSVGKLFSLIPKGLKFANRKHRMKQMNRFKELFGGINEISNIAYLLSLELTLAKQSEIEAHEKMEYEGLAKIKGLFELGKENVVKQWKDLTTSDTTGVKLKPTEELAIRDCAFIMQKVTAEEVSIDSTRELIPQLVEVVIGKPYKSIELALSSTITTPVNPVSLPASPLALVSPIASPLSTSSSPATLSDVETLKQLLREQQEAARRHDEDLKAQKEALRRQQIEAEAARAETKALAEKLAKVQKQLQATDVDGGAEALIVEKPEASSSSTSSVSYAEFHALKKQVTMTSQITEETAERMDVMSRTVYDLQDDKRSERKKMAAKQITYARDRDAAQTKQRQEEERVQEARKSKSKRFMTAKDLM